MSSCKVCHYLDLELLKRRQFPDYAKDTKPNEFGAGLSYLDKMAEGGCTICKILRRGADTARDEWAMKAEDYDHVSATFEILDCCIRGIIKVNGYPCADIEYFTEPSMCLSVSPLGSAPREI
jgi:hypothetical protein